MCLLFKRLSVVFFIVLLSGCAATATRGNVDDEVMQKQFLKPSQDEVSLYVYRDHEGFFGNDVTTKRKIWVNSKEIGGLIARSYFYIKVPQGITSIETESEFGNNHITFDAIGGRIYFIKQSLKMGVWLAGADVELTHDLKGKENVLTSKLLKSL